jgi:hypothetical protein
LIPTMPMLTLCAKVRGVAVASAGASVTVSVA